MEKKITISVRNLVEFVMRTGDIDRRFAASERMQEGSRAHRRIQKASPGEYTPEVPLSITFEYRGFEITLDGRADGIIIEQSGCVTVDEIKSTRHPIDEIDENFCPLHWAQAECYAYIVATQKELDDINVRLTYCEPDGPGIRYFHRTYSRNALEEFIYGLFDGYIKWAEYETSRVEMRDKAIRAQPFPFENYRIGQRKLAVAVYRTIVGRNSLFAQAPTGIGKTISTLFPSVKAIGEGKAQKIFYLTAKNITRQVAQEAVRKMDCLSPYFKTVILTAKDKVCPHPDTGCSPDKCELAKGYYDRANRAVFELLNHESLITREVIEEYASKNRLCPFEFALDISEWADCIICDYNYVFDPIVCLRRYFADMQGQYIFLIDEAHNMVDRARDMYSSELSKTRFLDIKRLYKKKSKKISSAANGINKFFLSMRRKCSDALQDYLIEEKEENELYRLVELFVRDTEKWLTENQNGETDEKLLELYFNCLTFLKIRNFYDERYVTLIRTQENEVTLKLYCIDPSSLLSDTLKKGTGTVFFSATLSPLEYFRQILGGGAQSTLLQLQSPFRPENLCLLVADGVSTRFKNRADSCGDVAELIKTMLLGHIGNYIIYFPSYKYMNAVYTEFSKRCPGVKTIVQEPQMSEDSRERFLENFKEDARETLAGFCVLGGVFSEGIDLTGSRLIGAAVVGVGLPQIGVERKIIQDYFSEKNGMGFEYAYMYPGMNKVLQAAGRVIRSENDRGVVLLIDDRFTRRDYRELFPPHWEHFRKVRSCAALQHELNGFWRDNQKSEDSKNQAPIIPRA